MKSNLQRFLSVFLALTMVVSLLPTAVFAVEEHDHVHEEEIIVEDIASEDDGAGVPVEEESAESVLVIS